MGSNALLFINYQFSTGPGSRFSCAPIRFFMVMFLHTLLDFYVHVSPPPGCHGWDCFTVLKPALKFKSESIFAVVASHKNMGLKVFSCSPEVSPTNLCSPSSKFWIWPGFSPKLAGSLPFYAVLLQSNLSSLVLFQLKWIVSGRISTGSTRELKEKL